MTEAASERAQERWGGVPKPQPDVLTVREAAARLGISDWLAYKDIRQSGTLGGAPVLKIGGRLVVPRRLFMKMLGLEE